MTTYKIITYKIPVKEKEKVIEIQMAVTAKNTPSKIKKRAIHKARILGYTPK
jgi:hypothetical protein